MKTASARRGTAGVRCLGTLGVLGLVLACRSQGAAAEGGNSFVVRGARVFDGDQVVSRASVLVVDGRIAAMGTEVAAPPGVEEIDGAGRTLLPGLIDAHAHTRGSALREQLVFGVTTVLDMSTNVEWAAAMRQEQSAGLGLDRADLRSAGTLVTVRGGHGAEYESIPTLSAAAEAPAFVDARVAEGSDYIKVVYDDNLTFGRQIPTLDKPTLAAVVAAAHARGKLAVVHIGSVAGAYDALEAGADGLVHLSPDRSVDRAFVALAKRRGAFIVPTLSLNESLCGVASGESLLTDKHMAPFLSDFSVGNLARHFKLNLSRPLDFGAVLASVATLHEAGVPILAGTDAPNPGTAHGASIHRELELLVRAGLTPIEALRAATAVPAQAFAMGDRGRIAVGRRADLVLVDGDPTANIHATRNIVRIWKLGRPVDREGYRASLGPRRQTVIGVALSFVALAAIIVMAQRRRATPRAGQRGSPTLP